MDKSEKYELNKRDWRLWVKSAIVWSAPVFLMYISAVLGVMQMENHVFSWNDLVPTTLTQGGLVAWGLMRLQDLLIKFVSDSK